LLVKCILYRYLSQARDDTLARSALMKRLAAFDRLA
jgi:hypothetical protein